MTSNDANAERRRQAQDAVRTYLTAAADSGPTLTPDDRAEHGRAVIAAYSGLDQGELLGQVLDDLTTDIYHYADTLTTPDRLLSAALIERSRTVTTLPALLALGDDGTPGILACTLAAVLTYAEDQGESVEVITDRARTYWRDETESARLAALRTQTPTD